VLFHPAAYSSGNDFTEDVLGQPVADSIDEYREDLERKGRDDKHVSETIRLVRKALSKCGCAALADLQRGEDSIETENSIEKYLASRRKSGVSPRTVNADLAAIRSFCRWLKRKKRLTADPTANLQSLDESVDRRRTRRALTDDEALRLFKTTLESDHVFRGLSGRDRAMLYMVAQRSGLRRGELLSLTPRSFKLDREPPTVRVEAGASKHRKEDLLPLPADVAKELSAYLKGKQRSKPIWPGTWWEESAEMFRVDLAAAEIPITDEDGTVLDFHGQRTTFITGLARAGVLPAKAQKLARHSNINLTMQAYTHLQVDELASAVESLPSLRGDKKSVKGEDNDNSRVTDPELDRVIEVWLSITREARDAIAAIIAAPASKQTNE